MAVDACPRAAAGRPHADMLVDERLSAGVDPAEARRRVLAGIGSLPAMAERVHDARAGASTEETWRDFRQSLRMLRRAPTFTVVALVTLAFGIGANTAVFQLVDAVMLRTLPVSQPEELVDIRMADRSGARGSFNTWRAAMTYPIWEQVRQHTDPFEGLFAWGTDRTRDLAAGGEPRPVDVLRLSSNAFDVLGVRASVGRVFSSDGDRLDCGAAGVVISDAFWTREYARDTGVTGRTVSLSGRVFPIIGVTPASFTGLAVGERFDVAVPLCAESHLYPGGTAGRSPTVWWLSFVGRLKPEWSRERTSEYLAAVSPSVFSTSLPPSYPAASVERYLATRLAVEPFGAGVSNLRLSTRRR